MATLSNHHDAIVTALKKFNISDDTAYKVGQFTSVYADNPGNTTVTLNNRTGTPIDYGCIKPLTSSPLISVVVGSPFSWYCKQEDKRTINYTATSHSQDNSPNETVRHSMLSTDEKYQGITVGKLIGDGINAINFRYQIYITQRTLLRIDFYNILFKPQEAYILKKTKENTQYLPYISQDREYQAALRKIADLRNEINQKFKRYEADVQMEIIKLRILAKIKGMRFGWEHIFKAAEKAKKTDFRKWEVDSNDSVGESGLALLGVGIHAIQDATIHQGEDMEHFETVDGKAAHLHHDIFVGNELEEPTLNAVIVFLLASENYQILKLQDAKVRALDIDKLNMGDTDKIIVKQKILTYISLPQ